MTSIIFRWFPGENFYKDEQENSLLLRSLESRKEAEIHNHNLQHIVGLKDGT